MLGAAQTGASSAPERQDRMSGISTGQRLRGRTRRTENRTGGRRRPRQRGDAAIARAVASDPDSFIPDAAWFKRARLVTPPTKKMVTLRLDLDVLEWFRRRGKRYQTRINAVLRAFVEAQHRS
ncbi:MAG: BrnA antitoxin family protein, partial [Pseudomonadota bacterium]